MEALYDRPVKWLDYSRKCYKSQEINTLNTRRDLQLAGLSRLERDPQWVVPHFDSKGDIEAYMVAIGLPATYLR